MPLTPGQTLNNRYRIVTLLGQGGFGAVYQVWDNNLSRHCAVKENLNITPEAQRQFSREATLLANLTHPNLPRVTDHFLIPGQGQYLVMDFVEGDDLQALLNLSQKPLSEAQALAWVGQILDALIYLHSQNPPIIHRDIKPANIKITPNGKAMLVDFGIAKTYDPHVQTTMGARAVTPGYSPTEQYGQGVTDARSDVYALGATLYTLLTGSQPPESIQRSLGTQTPPPRALNPLLSANTELAILKAMQVLPQQRFQSVAEFKAALRSPSRPEQVMRVAPVAQAQPAVARPVSRPLFTPSKAVSPQAATPRRIPWGWMGAVVAIVLVIGVVGFGVLVSFLAGGGDKSKDTDLHATQTALALFSTHTILLTPTSLNATAVLTSIPTVPGTTSGCDIASPGNPVDVTIPDNTAMSPGTAFTKIWRLQNTGACTWTKQYSVALFSGDGLGAPSSILLPAEVAPGQVIDIAVDMVAPLQPGAFQGSWKLRNASNAWFGVGAQGEIAFWVKIMVVPGTSTPTFTPTPSLPAKVIEPYCSMFNQSPQYVNIGQPVTLWWRWDAKTKALVEDHIAAALYEIYLDGVRIYPEHMDEIEYLSDKQFYRVSWYTPIGVLSAGKHRAERYLSWTRLISDGWDTFGPGGKFETEYHFCDIIVQ